MEHFGGLRERLGAYLRVLKAPLSLDSDACLTLPLSCIEAFSPFYLLLDRRGTVLNYGASFRLVHGACPRGAGVATLVQERDGAESHPLNGDELHSLIGRTLRLEPTAKQGFEFAAQLIPLHTRDRERQQERGRGREVWILDLRPILETLEDLEASGLTLQDVSLVDPIRVSMVTMLMESSLRQELLLGINNFEG